MPYTSTMMGEKSSGLKFELTWAGTGINQGCNGWFIKEVYNPTGQYEYLGHFSMQVVEGLSDSIKEWSNHHEKEFSIEFEFIGTGYECIYIDGLTEYTVLPSPRPVELVKITKIVEVP